MSGPHIAAAMDRFAVCICSYNRPTGLTAVLGSLARQRLSRLAEAQITVIVIDNSPEASARETCAGVLEGGRFAWRYVHEPRKGLAYARNACLAAAKEEGAAAVLFIDDDEAAEAGWLEAMVAKLEASGVAAAVGPVLPLFHEPPSPWLPLYRFATAVPAPGGFAEEGYTGNTIIAMAAVEACELRFDERFNDSGGEDTMFFARLRAKGFRIAWAEEARVYETIAAPRMRASWLLRRWYRTGTVEARLSDLPPGRARLNNLGKGLARIGAGALWSTAALVFLARGRPDRFVDSFFTLCRGAGYLSGAFGGTYAEYDRAR
jgi:succinoglycan biosynthesis protein ExoM